MPASHPFANRALSAPPRLGRFFYSAIDQHLCGKQPAKSVPPKPYRLKANFDAAFVKKILNIAK
jgi:hypothetical protein